MVVSGLLTILTTKDSKPAVVLEDLIDDAFNCSSIRTEHIETIAALLLFLFLRVLAMYV